MPRRRKSSETLPFDTLRLEGSLFVPELLERASRGEATSQKEADYDVPKGLKLHDEYGRAFRIATALWQEFAPQMLRDDVDAGEVTRRFALDLLRQCLGYSDLESRSESVVIGDRGFPITAMACRGTLPLIIAPHTLGLDDPDPRFAITGSGAKRKSAHQLAQEFLNASKDCTWALVTNGRTVRLLRDAETLTRPNFLEFDLETILRESEDRYADFSALWRILHASRAANTPCTWEKWRTEGHAQGLRVRDGLRDGVTEALLVLGTGFLTHPENDALRQSLHDGNLTKEDYFQQLLRLIYRSLFLFCAEERELLHPPDSTSSAKSLYAQGYSFRRFRSRSLRQFAHDRHGDLWIAAKIVFRSLANGQPRLALPALGGLFSEAQCPDLDRASLTNRDLLSAMRNLRWFFDKKSGKRSAIDYRNMGPEELGSVYESLLELVPQLDLPARTFGFAGITDTASTSGNARKTTGSYYTPDSLVQELIKSALDPVIADRLAAQPDRPIEALLSITVCDPSCGSGHFLLAAARRLAEKLAELRAPDGAVHPDDYRHALREVASRCLYGVDINPMAVELCRVALWLETVDPGKPLGFLNHHIRTGNSLLGTTPDLIAAGLPDDTFTAIEGDDKTACAELKRRNKKEREGFGPLFEKEEQTIRDHLRHAATQIEAMDDSQPAALQQKEAAFTTSETAPEYRHAKLLADLWCAAFVIKKHYPTSGGTSVVSHPSSEAAAPLDGELLHTQDELFGLPPALPEAPPPQKKRRRAKSPKAHQDGQLQTPYGITTAHLRDFVQGKPLPADLQTEVEALARQYRFFHWHLAFPQVFDQGGFDCILGNPPWDTLSPDAKEFFAAYEPAIRVQEKDGQDATIGRLLENSFLARLWLQTRRETFACVSFIKNSGRFHMFAEGNLGKGDFNLYRMFVELALGTLRKGGRVGQVVPEGLYNGANCSAVRKALFTTCKVSLLFGFENAREAWFKDVHSALKFCIYVAEAGGETETFAAAFNIRTAARLFDVRESGALQVPLLMVQEFSPEALAIMEFNEQLDIDIAAKMYARWPKFGDQSAGPPTRCYMREIDMGNDRDLFGEHSDGVPLYEGRMVDQYDHRAKGYRSGRGRAAVWADLRFASSDKSIQPQWRIPEENIPDKARERVSRFRLGFCDVTGPTNERSLIATIIPRGFPAGHTVPTILFDESYEWAYCLWLAVANSFPMDWLVRQKVQLHLTYTLLDSLPFPRLPSDHKLCKLIVPLALRLACCGPEMSDFRNHLAKEGWIEPSPLGGESGGEESEDERMRLRARIEVIVARDIFGLSVSEMDHILATFPGCREREEKRYGEFLTRRLIMDSYDEAS